MLSNKLHFVQVNNSEKKTSIEYNGVGKNRIKKKLFITSVHHTLPLHKGKVLIFFLFLLAIQFKYNELFGFDLNKQ